MEAPKKEEERTSNGTVPPKAAIISRVVLTTVRVIYLRHLCLIFSLVARRGWEIRV